MKPNLTGVARWLATTPIEDQICEVCGCSSLQACPEGCSWAAPRLCSRCARPVDLFSEQPRARMA